MAKVITTELQHSGASGANITLDSSKNVTCENNLTVDGTTTLTGAVTLPAGTTSDTLSFRNLIINGSAIINQRGNSTGITGTHGFYGPDRWKTCITNYGTWSITQAADGPDGFSKSYKLDCTTADASPAASDNIYLEYEIEAQDLQCLSYGTSGAKDAVLSFWVKSNLTNSTWNFSLTQRDNSGKTIQAAYTTHGTTNTWKKITIPIPKDTAGSIDDNTAAGLLFAWYLGGGSDFTGTAISTSWASDGGDASRLNGATNMLGASTSNYIQFTGLQFEIDSNGSGVATEFEHRSYGEEEQRCQRYFFKNPAESGELGCHYGKAYSGQEMFANVRFPVTMRAVPTITAYGNGGTAGTVHKLGSTNPAYNSIDRLDIHGGLRINGQTGLWSTGDTDMYSFTFQAEAEI